VTVCLSVCHKLIIIADRQRDSDNKSHHITSVVCRGGSRKKYLGGGPGPLSFGRQQRLSEITIEPITSTTSRTTVSKNWGVGLGKIWGPAPPGPNIEPSLVVRQHSRNRSLLSACVLLTALAEFIICLIALAYSMVQIIKLVSSMYVSIHLCTLSRSHFLIDFHINWRRRKKTPKLKTSLLEVNIAHPSTFYPPNSHFRPRGPENSCQY